MLDAVKLDLQTKALLRGGADEVAVGTHIAAVAAGDVQSGGRRAQTQYLVVVGGGANGNDFLRTFRRAQLLELETARGFVIAYGDGVDGRFGCSAGRFARVECHIGCIRRDHLGIYLSLQSSHHLFGGQLFHFLTHWVQRGFAQVQGQFVLRRALFVHAEHQHNGL